MTATTNDAVAFSIIKQALVDRELLSRLVTDAGAVLMERGFSDPRERAEVEQVMAALWSNYAAQQQDTFNTALSFKSGLRDTITQIERGFRATMTMYTVAFYLGVTLIAAAVAMAFVKDQALLPVVFGSLGVADVIAYFITKPPQDLQFSRARLAQLQAAFYNWFFDYTNWNGVLAQKSTADLVFQDVKAISDILMQHTERTMELIDKYCGTPRAAERRTEQ